MPTPPQRGTGAELTGPAHARDTSGLPSKAAVLALTATVAAELDGTPVMVNAVDPDLTATWPGAQAMSARPVTASVPGIVWAATLPDGGPRGGFYRDGRPHRYTFYIARTTGNCQEHLEVF